MYSTVHCRSDSSLSQSSIGPIDQFSAVNSSTDSPNFRSQGQHTTHRHDDVVFAKRFRTQLCRNFTTKGRCPYDARCMFAHGPKQLRTTELNLRDGLVSEKAILDFKKATMTKRMWRDEELSGAATGNTASTNNKRNRAVKSTVHQPPVADCSILDDESHVMNLSTVSGEQFPTVSSRAGTPAGSSLGGTPLPSPISSTPVHSFCHNPYARVTPIQEHIPYEDEPEASRMFPLVTA